MPVDNSCTCSHHRSKHNEVTNNELTILSKCTEDKCTCQLFKQMKSQITPVQIKYLFVGTVVFFALILSTVIGIAMVNGSVDKDHERYYQIWKGDIDNFEERVKAEYGENVTLSNVSEYLNHNAREIAESKNASGVVVPVLFGFVILLVLILVMYDRERKEELLI